MHLKIVTFNMILCGIDLGEIVSERVDLCSSNPRYNMYIVMMVVIVNGDSEIGARMWSEIGSLIYLRHLFKLTAIAKFSSDLGLIIVISYW